MNTTTESAAYQDEVATSGQMLEQWEYKILEGSVNNNGKNEKQLNELGLAGWELVAVHVQPGGLVYGIRFHLKRNFTNRPFARGRS